MASGWIELEGAFNVRDLGGLPAADRITRSGVLLRSDALDALTPADVGVLVDDFGLRQVIDLRAPAERAERGEGRLQAAGVPVTELAVIDDLDIGRRRVARAEAFASGDEPVRIMAQGYVELLDLGAAAFADAVERIAAPHGTPVLIHCSAGKDRTGVLAALLLDAAGVERQAIVDDYAATQERMVPVVERLLGAEAYQALAEHIPTFDFEAHPQTMSLFLDQLDRGWGGGAGFLRAQGVREASLETWRQLF